MNEETVVRPKYWPYAIVDDQGLPSGNGPLKGIPIMPDARKMAKQLFKLSKNKPTSKPGHRTSVVHGGGRGRGK